MGVVAAEDAGRIRPEHLPAITAVMGFMDMECAHSDEVCELERHLYEEELTQLADAVDLEDCDRVVPDKSFGGDEIGVNIPDSMIPFMRDFVLPAIREILNGG